ncbi:MAG: DUF6375 family protein [Actinobacteria bacterium]|nr:DUF6375 family protein [Actinomycetota bacterium]
MKMWRGYGTEHSMNLKLIGHFAEARDARAAEEAIKELASAAERELDAKRLDYGEPPQLFSDEFSEVMRKVEVYSLGHADIEQFLYDAEVKSTGVDVVVQTDEIDVIAFVKVLIAKGAKVEMYSMHDHGSDVAGS